MAGKKLFSEDLAAATNTTVGTVPAGKVWSFTIVFCNRTDYEIFVRFAVGDSATPDPSEYYMYDIKVPPNNTLERSGHLAEAGKLIVCRADRVGLAVNGHGYEE